MIRPYFASEKLLAGPPFRGCRVSTLWHGFAMATANESALRSDARPKGKEAITADLQRGWDAFRTVADSNNTPDQGDVARICEAMFPDLPKPTVTSFDRFPPVINLLDSGKAVSIALKLSVLPASSPLRRFTSADHQVLIHGHKGTRTRLVDPMHPHSTTYTGTWVELDDVRKAAMAFGDAFVEVFPVEGWTAEKLLQRNKVAPLKAENAALTASRDKLQAANTKLKGEVAVLMDKLTDCQAGATCDAVVTALLDDLQTELDARRPA